MSVLLPARMRPSGFVILQRAGGELWKRDDGALVWGTVSTIGYIDGCSGMVHLNMISAIASGKLTPGDLDHDNMILVSSDLDPESINCLVRRESDDIEMVMPVLICNDLTLIDIQK